MKNRTMKRWLAIAAMGTVALAACENNPVDLPESASVTVSPESMTMYAGEMATVTAQVIDQNGRVLRGADASWSSSAPGVASVVSGQVRAVAPGTATLQATHGEHSATIDVTVRADTDEAASVEVMEESVEMHVNSGTQYVSYRVLDERGRTNCTGELGAEVASSDQSVVEAGLASDCRIWVNPQFNGTATVTLAVDGVTDSFEVTVVSDQYGAFWAETPAQNEAVAGATVEYSVRVLDQQNEGVEGQTVNFSVDLGRLESTSVVTDADGYATVSWVLPETLGMGNQYQDYHNGYISYRTDLPDGQVSDSQLLEVHAAEAADIRVYHYDADAGEWYALSDNTVTAETGEQVLLGGVSFDEFGNQRRYWFVRHEVEAEDPLTSSTGYTMMNNEFYVYYRSLTSLTPQTATVTVFDSELNATFEEDDDFFTTVEVTWEDPTPAT